MKFKTKLILFFIVGACIPLAVLTGIAEYRMQRLSEASLAVHKRALRVEYDALLKTQVNTVMGLLAFYEGRVRAGEMTVSESKRRCADIIRTLKYSSESYFWIDTIDGDNVVLYGSPSEGKNRIGLQDVKGKYIVRDIIAQGRQEGGGYTDYWFPRVGGAVPELKRGYSLEFKPWGWIVGTGNYIDDVNEKAKVHSEESQSELATNILLFSVSATLLIFTCLGFGFLMVTRRTADLEREVIDRTLAEAALLEREERFQLYLQRLPIACILWSKDFRVQSWNPAAEQIFGYSEAEALGKTAHELIMPESAQDCVDRVWESVRNGELDAGCFNENVTRDGRTILCEWTNTPYFDKNGKVEGVVSVAQDVTQRKQTEKAMIQSEKMVMIAGMAAGMAHEVNNPLGIIAQDLQNMERRFSPGLSANCMVADALGLDLNIVGQYMERRDITTFMINMRSAVKRASCIISNMLQFSRQSDSSHLMLNLNEVIDQSIALASSDFDLRKKYDFKHISISKEYELALPSVSINLTEIEQVLINILKNAAQAMCETGTLTPSIIIRTFCNNEYVVAVIADNGPGMSEEVRQRIFDPFFTTKEVGSGTGLGLSVSYSIVTQNHGGELSVDSSPANGTCFTIKLPRKGKEHIL